MQGLWLDKTQAFAKAPELTKYIAEWENIGKLGISSKGNIKYTKNGTLFILGPKELKANPWDVFPALFDGITTPQAPPPSDTEDAIIIGAATMADIFPEVAQLGTADDYILQNGSLYQRRPNKKKKRKKIAGKYGAIGPVLCDFFAAFPPENVEYIKEIIRQRRIEAERCLSRVLRLVPEGISDNYEFKLEPHECFLVLCGRMKGNNEWRQHCPVSYLTSSDEDTERIFDSAIRVFAKLASEEQTALNYETAKREAVSWFCHCIEEVYRTFVPNMRTISWHQDGLPQAGSGFPKIPARRYSLILNDGTHLSLPGITLPERLKNFCFETKSVCEYIGDRVDFVSDNMKEVESYLRKKLKKSERLEILSFGSELKKVLSAVYDDYAKDARLYNQWAEPILTAQNPVSAGKSGILKSVLVIQSGKQFCELHTAISDYTVRPDGKQTKHMSETFRLMKEECRRARYRQAVEFYKEMATKSGLEVCLESGSGILYGPTTLIISGFDITDKFPLNTEGYRGGLTAWKKAVSGLFSSASRALKEKKENRKQAFIKKNIDTLGSFLALDILKFVRQNNDYITANATADYLRGLTIKFSGRIIDTGTYGKYNLLKTADVLDSINRLLRSGALTYKTLKGAYGKFDILKISGTTEALIAFPFDADGSVLLRNLRKKASSGTFDGKQLNDVEAEAVFKLMNEQDCVSIQDCMILLYLLRSSGFLCAYFNQLVSFCKAEAPSEFIDYLKMRKEVEENPMLLKFIREVIKKGKPALQDEKKQEKAISYR